jgi:hypothetical protein
MPTLRQVVYYRTNLGWPQVIIRKSLTGYGENTGVCPPAALSTALFSRPARLQQA